MQIFYIKIGFRCIDDKNHEFATYLVDKWFQDLVNWACYSFFQRVSSGEYCDGAKCTSKMTERV